MMNEFKGTPGPWEVHPMKDGYTAVGTRALIARVWSERLGDHENEAANARLIAAAPDLLEALDELANGYAGNRWDVGIAQRLAKARAAIAKALGEAK